MHTTATRTIIDWRQEQGGWVGRGPSGTSWTISRDRNSWFLDTPEFGHDIRAIDPKPIMDAVNSLEAMKFALRGGDLSMFDVELLLKARNFAISQRTALVQEMEDAGFDPLGITGPREEWMVVEIQSCDRAINAFESTLVDLGWQPTMGS